ncbi:LSU ribosomal protein L3P [Giardia duodenalis]|uniref:LSU ribosomal protein L3P n=1 Tax=Giardia intestinalis TaxID=5741 RepID=V6TRV4_GIAIN|nr:LSU ribosomal protein L3P [Giardia intestinalis]
MAHRFPPGPGLRRKGPGCQRPDHPSTSRGRPSTGLDRGGDTRGASRLPQHGSQQTPGPSCGPFLDLCSLRVLHPTRRRTPSRRRHPGPYGGAARARRAARLLAGLSRHTRPARGQRGLKALARPGSAAALSINRLSLTEGFYKYLVLPACATRAQRPTPSASLGISQPALPRRKFTGLAHMPPHHGTGRASMGVSVYSLSAQPGPQTTAPARTDRHRAPPMQASRRPTLPCASALTRTSGLCRIPIACHGHARRKPETAGNVEPLFCRSLCTGGESYRASCFAG